MPYLDSEDPITYSTILSMYVEACWMRIYDDLKCTFFIILLFRDSSTLRRTMVENSTDELDNADPDGVDDDIEIDSIPENEGEEASSSSTVAAVSLSVPDSPVTRVLHDIHSDLAEQGYDSDGLLPFNLEEEEIVTEEKAVLDFKPGDVVDNEEPTEVNGDIFVLIPEEILMKLKVDELREELSKRGVSKTGKKAELQEKLRIALRNRTPLLSVERASAAPNGFEEGARWRLLDPEIDELPDPVNEVATAYAPSDRTVMDNKGAKKFNYNEVWDRSPFISTTEQPQLSSDNLFQGNFEQPVTELTPNLKFIDKHNLNTSSHPCEWLRAFLPNTADKHADANAFAMDKWATYTNMKARMEFAGMPRHNGSSYKFKDFTPEEIEKYIAVYMIQGLNHSPQISAKFKSQEEDPIQGNDGVASVLGEGCQRRHKQFRKYLAIQNPHRVAPSTKTHPNFKVDPLLKQLNLASIEAMHLPQDISVDEQSIGFSGMDRKKIRMKHKKKKEGYQADAICCRGYTYTFYFRHQAPPADYIEQGFAPLHARITFMFDQLKASNHNCFMDNLYMSALFAKRSKLSKNKVNIHGVTRKDLKGIPSCVMQTKLDNKDMAQKARGTIKVAVLEGDPGAKYLLAISIYDSKPVYFLSSVLDRVYWQIKTRKVYNPSTRKMYVMKYHRTNFQDRYNMDMNGVDRADQLINYYEIGAHIRNTKWWWSIFLWALGTACVNAYLLYKQFMKSHGMKPLSHYEFRKCIALGWLDWNKYWPTRYEDASKPTRRKRSRVAARPAVSVITRSTTTMSQGSDVSIITQNSIPVKRCRSSCAFEDTTTSAYQHRLQFSAEYNHLPETVKSKSSECQLHKWVLGGRNAACRRHTRVKSQLSYCPTCNVVLCIKCYKLFHTIYDLNTIKGNIQRAYEEEINDPESNDKKVKELISDLSKFN